MQPKIASAGDSMSLFNASDRIAPFVDRQAVVRRLEPLLYAATCKVHAPPPCADAGEDGSGCTLAGAAVMSGEVTAACAGALD